MVQSATAIPFQRSGKTIVLLIESGIVGHPQPIGDLGADVAIKIIPFKIFILIAVFQRSTILKKTTRNVIVDIFSATACADIVFLGKFLILENDIPPIGMRVTGIPSVGSSGLYPQPLIGVIGISCGLFCNLAIGILADLFHLFGTYSNLPSGIEAGQVQYFRIGERIYKIRHVNPFLGPKTIGVIN